MADEGAKQRGVAADVRRFATPTPAAIFTIVPATRRAARRPRQLILKQVWSLTQDPSNWVGYWPSTNRSSILSYMGYLQVEVQPDE